jgi:IclR family transcriptional regulator, KDG regulon repressor
MMESTLIQWKDVAQGRDGTTASTERVLLVLDAFDTSVDALTASELARRVGLPVSTTHRLLQTLTQRGYVERDRDGRRYKLGLRVFQLASRALAQHGLRDTARPYLVELVRETQETVQLAVLHGSEALYIDKVEGSQDLRVSTSVGSRTPLHCTAAGKALLAFQPPETIDVVLGNGLHRFTPRTITDPEQLLAELDTVRARGVAVLLGEYRPEAGAIAAPIFRAGREIVAAVGLAGPLDRIEGRLNHLADLVARAAQQISARLL